ncbi:glutamine synthetase beta-grasp domain-containing protein, partial [Escherichia sp. TWPC-MK]
MSAEHVLTMLNEHEVKFVDLRFTDTKGKEQHVTIPAHQVNAEFFEEGKMFDGSSIGHGRRGNEICNYFGRVAVKKIKRNL